MKHLDNSKEKSLMVVKNKRKGNKKKVSKIKVLKRLIFIALVVSSLVLSNLISQKSVDYLLTLDRDVLVNGFNVILITIVSAIIFKD